MHVERERHCVLARIDENLSSWELHIISCVARYVKEQIDVCVSNPDGWKKLMKEVDDLIDVVDKNLGSNLIAKLYQTTPL